MRVTYSGTISFWNLTVLILSVYISVCPKRQVTEAIYGHAEVSIIFIVYMPSQGFAL